MAEVFTDKEFKDVKFLDFLLEIGAIKRRSIRYLSFTSKFNMIFKNVSLVDKDKYLSLKISGLSLIDGKVDIIPRFGIVSRSILLSYPISISVYRLSQFNLNIKLKRFGYKLTNSIEYSGILLSFPSYILSLSIKVNKNEFLFTRTTDIGYYNSLINYPDKKINKSFIRLKKVMPSAYLIGYIKWFYVGLLLRSTNAATMITIITMAAAT